MSEAAVAGNLSEYPLTLAATPATSSTPDKRTAGIIFMTISLCKCRSIADREMIVAAADCRHRPGFPPVAGSFRAFRASGLAATTPAARPACAMRASETRGDGSQQHTAIEGLANLALSPHPTPRQPTDCSGGSLLRCGRCFPVLPLP